MKRAALYSRISTADQNATTQLLDLRQLASQRDYQIVAEFSDVISGVKARRPGLDALMADGRRGKFDVVLVWACDRIARSTRHFLGVLDEFNRLEIEFVSFRESIDTSGPLGRAIVIIVGAIAELERSLIVERVRAGMRRARLEGRHIGRHVLPRGFVRIRNFGFLANRRRAALLPRCFGLLRRSTEKCASSSTGICESALFLLALSDLRWNHARGRADLRSRTSAPLSTPDCQVCSMTKLVRTCSLGVLRNAQRTSASCPQ